MIRQPVNSSTIASVGYNPDSAILEIEFHNGGVYRYTGVPGSLHGRFMAAASLGSFLHQHIKGSFPYQRIG